MPLSFDSGHRESCKMWWPLAEARRYARSCSSFADWKAQVRKLISRIPDYPRALHRKMLDPDIHLRRCVAVNGRARSGCVIATSTRISTRISQHPTHGPNGQSRSDFVNKRSVIMKLRHNSVSSKLGCLQVFDQYKFLLQHKVNFIVSWLNPDRHLRIVSRVTWPKHSILE